MHSTPMKECNTAHCRTLIPYDQRYCTQHKHRAGRGDSDRRYDKYRNEKDKKFRRVYHSSRWRKLRLQVLLRDDYVCQECRRNSLYTLADVVDHIIELRDDMGRAYDLSNLESLCHACHNSKTKDEKQKRFEVPPRF